MIPAFITDSVSSDFARSLETGLLWGLEAIVLRSVDGAIVPDINVPKVGAKVASTDLPVVGIIPEIFSGLIDETASWSNDLLALREAIRFTNRFGCDNVFVSCFEGIPSEERIGKAIDILRRAAETAAQSGARIIVRQEFGSLVPSSEGLNELVREVNHPALGFSWSPAIDAQTGDVRYLVESESCTNVAAVEVRDIRFHDSQWTDCVVGEGVVDWPRVLDFLAGSQFTGPLILDVRTEPRRRTGLRSATRLLQLLREVEHKGT